MQILGLLGMYFDAVVVEVKTFLILFTLALAILCKVLILNWLKISFVINSNWFDEIWILSEHLINE